MSREFLCVMIQDRLEIAPSIVLPSVIWACLLHPGSTNSSGVIGAISGALEKVFVRCHQDEERAARAAAVARGGAEDYEHPPRRQVLSGGGSLAATGLQMSQEQNRGAAVAVEPEIEHIVQWLTAPALNVIMSPFLCILPAVVLSWNHAS
jgi:hypothetical protein